MKNLLKILKKLVLIILIVEIYNLGFFAMTYPNTIVYYLGLLMITITTVWLVWYICNKILLIINHFKEQI